MNYTTCQGAFADGFHDESAGNTMTLSGHARDDIVLTPWEIMKSTVCECSQIKPSVKMFTDKAISQNVQLLGCVCNLKSWNRSICCIPQTFVAPTKKP